MSDSLHRYLEALGAQNWDALEATLAENVFRIGPYGDVVEGRGAYRAFLERVVSQLEDYLLQVERVDSVDRADPAEGVERSLWVRLSETVRDESGGRLRTEEALEFGLDAEGKIARVAVYTQKSERLGPEDAH